ncbi:MAG: DUF4968 domain-containing protein [Spirochaetes bacterium]|nr:DUF4968 domain-containing protein [Spirochaetota bacterium]
MLGKPVDVSGDFFNTVNTYFIADRLAAFNASTGAGTLSWSRHARKVRTGFNNSSAPFEKAGSWEFPPVYDENPELPFELSFARSDTLRLRIRARAGVRAEEPSLMLAGAVPTDSSWICTETADTVRYQSARACVEIQRSPWKVKIYDASGKLLTATQHISDTRSLQNCLPLPFCAVRCNEDFAYRIAATFSLAHDEKIFGCGESFTRLDKRGQSIPLCTVDPHGVQSSTMYKPVPFFMSSRGYGMFVHASTPMTFDFGARYDGAATLYLGDEMLDLFIFIGEPKEILSAYTTLTGKSPLPPLWSFGLWMSRITYKSEEETRDVAKELRSHRIPCDVIHLDTGWFETDWQCDYRFSPARFTDPAKMIADLRKDGFHFCLWQLPYFTPKNRLFGEIVARGLAVLDAAGGLPTEDAILDFSNPSTVAWYRNHLASLFDMGVEAIKADFGEAAPLHGMYASGKTGWFEHNLYPLRYNETVFSITDEKTGAGIIWGRSAWAGSQRYPLHWGGDAENTDSGMAASLRGGLSLGLCGFTFWSHDIGGFVKVSPEELYRRWLPFGMLTSHSRCHGKPPKEPWLYNESFTDAFRAAAELKYRLMPYVYAQAAASAREGYPMVRTLFFEYPDDRTSWLIEDEYFFGTDMLVAPLMDEGTSARDVYIPPGIWIDYQTDRRFDGGQWHHISAGAIPIVLLIRNGSVLPHAAIAQSTGGIDWTNLELVVYRVDDGDAAGMVNTPQSPEAKAIYARVSGKTVSVIDDPSAGAVRWAVRHAPVVNV